MALGLQGIPDPNVGLQSFGQGLRFAGQLAGLEQQSKLYDQRQQQLNMQQQTAEQQQAYNTALSGALEAGTPLNDLIQQYPQFAKQTSDFMKMQSDMANTDARNVSAKLLNAIQRGDVAGANNIIGANEDLINQVGDVNFKSENLRQLLSENPQGAEQMALGTYLLSGGKREDLARTQEEAITPYQREQIDISKESNELRRLEIEERKAQREAQKAQSAQKTSEAQAKAEKLNTERIQKERDIFNAGVDSIDNITESINAVDRVIDHPGFESAVGWQGGIWSAPGSDARNFESILETLKSQTFLSTIEQMKGLGALSEKEGDKIQAAVGALDLTMSEESFRSELERIKGVMDKSRRKLFGRMPKSPDKSEYKLPLTEKEKMSSPQEGQNMSSLWGG